MFHFILNVVEIPLLPLSSAKKDILLWTLTVRKGNTVLHRSLKSKRKRAKFRFADRVFYSIVKMLRGNISRHFTIVKPETVLKWTRNLIKRNGHLLHRKRNGEDLCSATGMDPETLKDRFGNSIVFRINDIQKEVPAESTRSAELRSPMVICVRTILQGSLP